MARHEFGSSVPVDDHGRFLALGCIGDAKSSVGCTLGGVLHQHAWEGADGEARERSEGWSILVRTNEPTAAMKPARKDW